MTRIDDMGLRLLALQVMAKRVDDAITATKDELAAQVSPGTTLRPLLDGRTAGAISYTLAKPRAKIVDPDGLGEWTSRRHPSEARSYWRATPGFAARLLTMAEAAEQPIGIHGELDDPPAGLMVVIGRPYIRAAVDSIRADDIWRHATTMTDLLEVVK